MITIGNLFKVATAPSHNVGQEVYEGLSTVVTT